MRCTHGSEPCYFLFVLFAYCLHIICVLLLPPAIHAAHIAHLAHTVRKWHPCYEKWSEGIAASNGLQPVRKLETV